MTTVSLQPGSAGIDTFIRSTDTSANFGAHTLMCVGATSAGGTQKGLIKFDLSSIPAGAFILSATLRLNVASENDASINLPVGVHRSLVEWFEGPNTGAAPGAGVNGSTWQLRNHGFGVNWSATTWGGLSGTDYVATATYTTTITGPGKFDWDVTPDVRGFIDGTYTNHGWWLHTTTITTNGQKNIDSSDSVTAGNRPELIVVYLDVASAPFETTLQPNAANGIDNYINSFSANNNHGASLTIQAGFDTASSGIRRGLIKFDLSSLPVIGTLHGAVLGLYLITEQTTDDYNFSVHKALTQWYEGDSVVSTPGAGVDASTWANRNHNGTVAWSGGAGGGSGTDYTAAATDTRLVTAPNAWYYWDVTTDITAFLASPSSNHGWFIKGNEAPATNSQKSFVSSDDTGRPDFLPVLILYYSSPDVGGEAHGTSTAVATLVGWAEVGGEAHGTSNAVSELVSTYPGSGEAHGTSTAVATAVPSLPFGGSSHGSSSAVAELIGLAVEKAFVEACEITPLLYITNGNIKVNGQLDMLDLLNPQVGFMLKEWNPAITQYKSGGYFSDSPLGEGRRLSRKVFENAIEVFTLALKSHNQNRVIQFMRDFFRWKEAASDYWVSDWMIRPVYIVARAPQETEIRYAPIHVMDIPAFTNPYGQPFYGRQWSAIEDIALRLERGAWADFPPGEAGAVAISSIRSYTVADWGEAP